MSSPFFPNPLDDFEPKRPDFEPEIDPDYDDNLEENCPVCNEQLGVHTTREIVLCALREIQGGKQL
ncbi:MAG: hypothetical protein K5793_08960 [Nitrosarchaeum sp.]|nr:hypothetical protein [Nitrosarchaeum sp.]